MWWKLEMEKITPFLYFRPRADCKQLFCVTSAKSIRVLRSFWETNRHFFYLDHNQRYKAYVPMLWQKSRHFVFIFLTTDCLFIIIFSKFPAGSQQLCCPNQSGSWKGLTPSDLLVCDQDQEWWMSYCTIKPSQITTHNIFFWSPPKQQDKETLSDNLMQKFINFEIRDYCQISMIIVKLKSHENAR